MSSLAKKAPDDQDQLLPELSPDEPQTETTDAPSTEVAPQEVRQLDRILDIPVRISAVLGKTRMSVDELMKLSAGAVIELDRKVGEPIDLYVNDRLIARGELVMVDGSLGVTMTEIMNDDGK